MPTQASDQCWIRLILAAASVAIILIRWITLPDDGGLGDLGPGIGGFDAGQASA